MKAIYLMPLVMFGMLVNPPSIAAEEFEILQLKHTVAEEIIPLIKPLLQPDAVITGKGYQLIVRATPSSLDTIRSIIQRIDVPQRILKITLRQVEHSRAYGSGISGSGSIELDQNSKIKISEKTTPQSEGIRPRAIRHTTQGQADTLYEVRATEGHVTFLRLGKLIPYELKRFITTGRHIGFGHSIAHKELVSGFFVVPRVQGEYISLEISSQRQRLSGDDRGTTESRYLRTVVRGRLGDWITLGTAQVGLSARDKKIASRTIDTSNDGFIVQVKVELVL